MAREPSADLECCYAEYCHARLDQTAIDILRNGAPDKLAWQILDSSAAVTRTYALWEQAICDLVEEYVGEISRLHPTYAGLAEAVRINHRVGVGYILSKWSPVNTLFSALSEEAIADGLVNGLRGNTYKLLTDAFLTDSDNYRADVVNRIFPSWVSRTLLLERVPCRMPSHYLNASPEVETLLRAT